MTARRKIPGRKNRLKPAQRRIVASDGKSLADVLRGRALGLLPRGEPDVATLIKLRARLVLTCRERKGTSKVLVLARMPTWTPGDDVPLGWVHSSQAWSGTSGQDEVRLAARDLGWEVIFERVER